jgi:DNA relaxase NicK
MSGKGCAQVEDWDALETVESLPRAELTRLDLALTTWRNEVNHDLVKTAYERGRFTTCGRPPNLESRLNSDKRKGQTLYVGSRTGHKFFRGYQKGYEMASKLGRVPGDLVAIDGFPVEDIYRCEMEFKNKDADLPWEMVDRRDQYFAGSYPFCADILPGIEADILQRRPEKGPQRELEAALANCRTQYGATLYTALRAYGGDIGAVWDKVIGDKHNPALVEAGVLLYEHE